MLRSISRSARLIQGKKKNSTANPPQDADLPSSDRWLLAFILQPHLCSTNIKRPSNCFFPFHNSQLLYPVNPYLTRGPTDVAQGEAVKLATGETAHISEGQTSDIFGFFLTLLCQMLMCLSHRYSHLKWRHSWGFIRLPDITQATRMQTYSLLSLPHTPQGSIPPHQDAVNRGLLPSGSSSVPLHLFTAQTKS